MMFKLYILLLGIFLILVSESLVAQNTQIGLYLGSNVNFTSDRTDYELEEGNKMSPGLGSYLSLVTKFYLSERISISGDLGYSLVTKNNKSEMYLYNPQGEPINKIENRFIINQYLQLNALISFKLFRNLYIGTGLSVNYLLFSHTYFKADIELEQKLFKNTYYSSFLFNIPIRVEYTFNEMFSMTLTFHKGVQNSLSGNESFIKEIDNTITLGMGINFGSNGED